MTTKCYALAILVAALGCSAPPATERASTSGRSLAAALADTADEPLVLIMGPARAALDSANALFKAKRYSHALSLYRAAARLAPDEPAPLLGMLMAAAMLEDDRLGDSVRVAIRTQAARGTSQQKK